MSGEVLVEIVFMMVILKIPVVYLCLVVYWAIRAEPRPPEPALSPAVLPSGLDPRPVPARLPRRPQRLPRRVGPRPRPHGGPVRTYARRSPAVAAGAD
jgi:hypothetical protein